MALRNRGIEMAERLVVVSNRVPLAAGVPLGSASQALNAALGTSENVLWFGWSGRLSEHNDARPMVSRRLGDAVSFVGVDLTELQYEGYLNGFANSTLWPLFHEMPDRVRFHADELALYHAVNALFATRLAPILRADDRIWIHDYHLIPLAGLLRQAGVKNPIGMYLHVPFPSAQSLVEWPWHRKLADDFAAYDLIGFQTRRDEANFQDVMRIAAPGLRTGGATAPRRSPATGVFPVGLSARPYMGSASSVEIEDRATRLGRCLRDRRLIISADRLDYTKGQLERLRAYEALLDQWREYRGTSSLVQITAPARPLVPGYLELRMDQQTLTERINARFLTFGWMPVLDIYARLPPRSLAALYRLGRVGLATPLRDGVNLGAKEYVAAQNPRDPGVLILSQFAGAAELLTEALLVDPREIGQMARALHTALHMPLDERQDRWRRMIVKLLHHDAAAWHRSFVCALARSHKAARSDIAVHDAIGEHSVLPAWPARVSQQRSTRTLSGRKSPIAAIPERSLRPDAA